MGSSNQTVTQKTQLDPYQQMYLYGTYGMEDREDFLKDYHEGLEQKNAARAEWRAANPPPSYQTGGIAALPAGGMRPQVLPNLGNPQNAYSAALLARGNYRSGGMIQGPGTGTSDSIPARIYQDGRPVSEARLSNGEVVLSRKDLANMDPMGDADRAANMVGNARNGSRGQAAAQMYQLAEKFRNGGRA